MHVLTLTEWKTGSQILIPASRICAVMAQDSDKSSTVVFDGGTCRVREDVAELKRQLSGLVVH